MKVKDIKKIAEGVFLVLVIGIIVLIKRDSNKVEIDFINKNNFSIIETYEDSKESFRALYKNDDIYLRIEIDKNINSNDLDDLLKTKENRFQELFQNEIAPYPGEVSEVAGCGEKFIPKKIESRIGSFYETYLNSRYQFGSCNENQLIYKGVVGFLKCHDNNLYQVVYFMDKNTIEIDKKIDEFMTSLRCF